MITRAARIAVRFPVAVIAGWLVMVVVLFFVGQGVEDKMQPSRLYVPGTEANEWKDLRQNHWGEPAALLLTGPAEELDRQGPALSRALARRKYTGVLSPWSGEGGARLRPKPDKAMFVLDIEVPPGQDTNDIVPPLERFVGERIDPPVETHLSGLTPLGRDINEELVDSLRQGERIAFPVLVIVLLLVFRTPMAAAIPLVMGVGSVLSGFGVIALIAEVWDLDAIALSLASMIGLALGVDYSLLIISRFRELLAGDTPPRQAASLAANTAGRTAIFAGTVLLAIMLATAVLSPGTVMRSAAVGAMVVTALSMLAAALVTPAVVRLTGPGINKWRIGGAAAAAEGAGRIGGIVRGVSRRPVLATAIVGVILLLFAAPVLALDTIPADPRGLPEGSKGLEDFNEVRKAGFGPEVDIALDAKRGAITDPGRLDRIERLEKRLRRVPYVSAVVGPGVLGKQTAELRNAPKDIKRAKRQVKRGERKLSELASGLDQAAGGVDQLRDGMSRASAGAGQLEAGANRARSGGQALAAGGERASQGASDLENGLDRAVRGSRRLTRGLGRARRGSARLAAGNQELSDRLNNELAPGADRLARELRIGQQRLNALRLPARITETEIRNAFNTLNAFTIGKTDPRFLEALTHVGTALGAATGTNPLTGQNVFPGYRGLEASIAQAASEAGRAADGADQIAAGARQAARGASRLSDGANDLHDGLVDLEDGSLRLQRGLERIDREVEASVGGLRRLGEGAALLGNGVGRLASGADQLQDGLAEGVRRSGPLESGLASGADEAALVRDQLRSRTGPFKQLRDLERLDKESPGFFESGYVVIAAIDGAPFLRRTTADRFVDAGMGGDAGRIVVLPDVPTNDPRQNEVVDDVRNMTHDFARRNGLESAAGGAAGQLVDYDRETSARIPLLVIAICIVTYLMLVPILRSLILPGIAVALNMVTVGVAFGVLTVLFVGDNPPLGGAGALDVVAVGGIFAITFALSIDYQVFLLTRMREEYVRTQSNDSAIRFGIEKTAKVVTGAAAIMVAVFAAFGLAEFVLVKQFGIGLTVAVLIDATLVRLVLLPAVMRMFGERTWWIPDWLDDRLPLFDVEGAAFEHESEGLRPQQT